nr:hypothetical protein [Streptomyces bathyalis]
MSAIGGRTMPAVLQRGQWLTIRNCKTVLVVVHTIPYAQRLRDVFRLLESDFRIQVVFTVAPHPLGDGIAEYLRQLGISTVPWNQAVSAQFDLALAAGSRGVHQLRAPLIRLSHGAGHIKLLREVGDPSRQSSRTAGMLSRQHLLHNGRVVPTAVAFAHERDLEELKRSCPEALEAATIVGDPCLDRITKSLPHRAAYRRALGVEDDRRLVVVSSTWGPSSTFGRFEVLLPQLLSQLPQDRFRVALLVHPNVWAGHGSWQVNSWLASCRGQGLAVLPPEADWEALLVAADYVIGDHGSLTAYSTAAGIPILLTDSPDREVAGTSPAAVLASAAPVVSPAHSLAEQLRYAAAQYWADGHRQVAETLSSEPGRFHRRMRGLMYRMLGLGEPAWEPTTPIAPLPPSLDSWDWPEDGVAA